MASGAGERWVPVTWTGDSTVEQAVGVLCTRVRVEEKGIIAALAAAGIPAIPFPPTELCLTLTPDPWHPDAPHGTIPGPEGTSLPVVLDRCPNRVVAATILPIWRALGVPLLDAGLAATGTRASVASALGAAHLPRPETRLVFGEEAALAAARDLVIPVTLLPMTPGDRAVPLWDDDTVEAVLEHRSTLGSAHDGVALLQAGTPTDAERATVLVLDGTAVAASGASRLGHETRHLAVAAAAALGATIAGVEIVVGPHGPVVWDVQPVPELRAMAPFDHHQTDLPALVAARLLARWPGVSDIAVVAGASGTQGRGIVPVGVTAIDLSGGVELAEGIADGIPLAV
ncbi:MAG: hypothetical protein AVDCRST_MAG70-698 [uncultured Thermomicrobiales bacterium]|uniref:Uncharacterized protein n=1 Tax=uncultured Thermomicrobiales bacterium TaxID=1645740 RepID=A0A6J4UFY6_9BACT|nr:MAG: hypothetical protein AVDCRST_MAG70-698 [uncultured Thermomicrobiales bacterium]